MKKFFKILRKIIKILLVIILFLISWVFVIVTVALVVINNRTLKLYENEDGDMRFTMSKDFKVEDGSELVLNLGKGTIIVNEIYDGEIDYKGLVKINLKKGIITSDGMNFDDPRMPGGYIDYQGIIKLKFLNIDDVKQAYKNGDIENWFETLRFFVDCEIIEYYENGQIFDKTIYVNGVENGPYISYYENGQVEEYSGYKDGNKNGYRIVYYKNGNISKEGNYKDGSPDGTFTGYFEDGSINFVYNFKNGFFDGKSLWYWNDGYADIQVNNGIGNVVVYDANNNIEKKYGFITNKLGNIMLLDGNYTQYFGGGEIFEELYYKNGKYDGALTGYYKDGSIRYLGNFENGMGTMSYFDEDGNLIGTGEIEFTNELEYGSTIQYYKSIKKGLDINFYDNGQIKEISNYSDGKLDGIQKIYYENGNLRFSGDNQMEKMGYRYVAGASGFSDVTLNKFEYYDKDGNLVGTGEEFCSQKTGDICIETQKTGNMLIRWRDPSWNTEIFEDIDGIRTIKNRISWYENGDLEYIQNFKDGKLDGEYFEYYENGNLKKKGNYLNGEKTGVWPWYYENGQLMEESYYFHGEEDGYRVEYFEDGKVFAEGNYNNGKRVGTRNRYLGDGSIGVSKNYDE